MAINNKFRVKNGLTVGGDIDLTGTIDGRDLAVDGAKLDNIESGATPDQTKADIDALNIDADTLDGQHGSYYAPQSTTYTKTQTDTAISNLVAAAPGTLDTLNELAFALNDDPNFATTVTNSIATKLPLAGGTITSGTNVGLTINHDTFGAGLRIHRNHSSNAPSIQFLNNSGTQGTLLAIDADDGLYWQIGTSGASNKLFHDTYHPNADKWTSARNHVVTLTGAVTGTATQSVDGTANETWTVATTATSDPTLTLTGDVTGTATFTNLGNATLTATVANDSHSHSNYLPTTTPSKETNINTIGNQSKIIPWNSSTIGRPAASQSNEYGSGIQLGYDGSYASQIAHDFDQDNLYYRKLTLSSDSGTWNKVWSSTNDGSGSGLDADLLDGQQGSYYSPAHSHPYLPLAGGTMSGGINYDNYFETYAASYTVSTTNRQALLWNGSTIPAGGTYRFTAHIDGTGTDNAATAVYWNQNGVWKLNVTCQSGTSSNNPEFIIENSVPTLITDHASNYTVRVYGERMQLREDGGTDNYNMFGADGFMSSVGNTLRYNPSGSGTTYATGNTVWHAGNSTPLPDGGTVGQTVINTAPGEGTWQDAAGGGGQWEFISEVVVSSSVTAVNVPTNLTNPTYGEVFKLEIINASLSGYTQVIFDNDSAWSYNPPRGYANWYSNGSSSGTFSEVANPEGLRVHALPFSSSAKTNITLEFRGDNVGYSGLYHKGSGVTYQAWNSTIFHSSGVSNSLAPSTLGISCSSIASGTFRLYKLVV